MILYKVSPFFGVIWGVCLQVKEENQKIQNQRILGEMTYK
jgi:hypothetical protein